MKDLILLFYLLCWVRGEYGLFKIWGFIVYVFKLEEDIVMFEVEGLWGEDVLLFGYGLEMVLVDEEFDGIEFVCLIVVVVFLGVECDGYEVDVGVVVGMYY